MSATGFRRFPTGAEYVDALQNTRVCFEDFDLKGAEPDFDKLGRPKPISGNFASVFALTSGAGDRFAVKCFTRETQDQEMRYRAISDHLAPLRHPWKVGFEYVLRGVMVAGTWYPVLKMQWVTGASLTRWIDANLHDRVALGRLAENFAELIEQLATAEIGHGDLQHGNLLVAPGGSLRLVDYDGMYVPALAGLPPAEMGHRNYQSPMRGQSEFGPDIDRFSAWVIYLALVAIAAEPSLWQQLHEPDGEYLLLSEGDFKNPATSIRFPVLLSSAIPEIRGVAAEVHDLATSPTSKLKALSAAKITVPSAASVPPVSFASPAASTAQTPRSSQGALPSWMAGHISQPPAQPPVVFSGRRPLLTLGLLIVTLLASALLLIPGLIGPLAALGGLGAGLTGLRFGYRRRPEVTAAQDVRQRRAQAAQRRRLQEGGLKKLEQEQRKLNRHAAKTTEDFATHRRTLQERFVKDEQRANRELQARLMPIERQLRDLTATRQRDLSTALSRMQDAYVRTRLARITIASSPPHGIGPTLIANLSAAGIRTAADFTGITFDFGSHQSAIAYFNLTASTRGVRVSGIGEVKAQTLEAWRRTHEDYVRKSQPTSLPAAERQAILTRFLTQEQQLKSQKAAREQEAATKRATAGQNLATQQAQLTTEERRAGAATAQSRANLNQHIATARAASASAEQALTVVGAEVTRYQKITFLHFLRFSLTG
ncbi:MAG TPA: hypothetical protein VGP70_12795 [Actinomadura sp.]|nr:hypothetical protein [Actinomadura sp.]